VLLFLLIALLALLAASTPHVAVIPELSFVMLPSVLLRLVLQLLDPRSDPFFFSFFLGLDASFRLEA
jgi:hypothetical protein